MDDRYLLAADLPGVLCGWCGPAEYLTASGWHALAHPQGGTLGTCPIRLDLHREEVQWLICLRWGPAHDRRGARAWGDTGVCEAHWISLLAHPDRIAAEVRAVLADLEELRKLDDDPVDDIDVAEPDFSVSDEELVLSDEDPWRPSDQEVDRG